MTMKTLPPITSATSPAAPAGDGALREQPPEEGASFADVLERQMPANKASGSTGEHPDEPLRQPGAITDAPVAAAPMSEAEGNEAAPTVEDSIDSIDLIDPGALFTAGLAMPLPVLPVATPESPRLALSLEGVGREEVGGVERSGPFPSERTEESLPTGSSRFPGPVDLRLPMMVGTAAPTLSQPLPLPVEFSSLQAIAARGGEELPVYPQSFPTTPTLPPPAPQESHTESSPDVTPEAVLDAAVPFTGLPVVPPGVGTTAAKRGEVMQNAHSIPAEETLRANSAEWLKTVDANGQVTSISASQNPAVPLKAEPAAPATPILRETRSDRPSRETVAAADLRTAETLAATPLRAPREAASEIPTTVRETLEARPWMEKAPETPAESTSALAGALTRPEPIAAAPLAPSRETTRAEVVQVIERTIDAALRLRASGQERLEVAVQLESGDRLTIQLRLANGEVTPVIRTSSDGLRAALEQNWNQLTDRAGDRGVRLTPPVFDMDRSSSNMSDLSQERHGRDQAHAEAQAELFPNLPRRMRAPRVLSPSAFESTRTATEGVRTYA